MTAPEHLPRLLRWWADRRFARTIPTLRADLAQAADRIEALEAERDILRAGVEEIERGDFVDARAKASVIIARAALAAGSPATEDHASQGSAS